MKKNDWALIISVLLYSILFYEQFAGINFLLFNAALVALLIYRNSSLLKSKIWISVAVGALISSTCIYFYGSALAIVANLFSLFILSALSIDPRTSFLTSIFLTICSVGSSIVFIILDWVSRKSRQVADTYKQPFYVKLFLIIIPFLIALIFFFFYQNSNPLFYEFTKDINLDFISWAWIFFTIGGLLLMYGFFHNRYIKGISDQDVNAELNLSPEIASRKNFLNGIMRIDTEGLSAMILFFMLNLLLLLLNVLDLNFLWFDGQLPQGMKHKEFVHDGIGTLITSIVVAILIILFYFRGELNYYKSSKWLRVLAFIWIAQNAFMIFSTAYRNNMYIDESGLSYKKIGVYVYLLLALIGLISTFIKIAKLKTNWYLFRVNASAYYFALVISCIFNWDVIITDFNIKKYTEEKKDLEKYLLVDLSFKNIPQLLALPDSIAAKDDLKARDYYYSLRGVYFNSFIGGRSNKIYQFLENYNKLEWPSSCKEKTRVYNYLFDNHTSITSLKFENLFIRTLKPVSIFNELSVLKSANGNLNDLSELKMFPMLRELDLSSNQLDTIIDFPRLSQLRVLDLSNNNITDIRPLMYLNNLEVLNISGYTRVLSYSPLFGMKKLKHLTVGQISEEELSKLKILLPNVKVNATTIINREKDEANN
ncbi:MAG: DUF4173 domain-containing protein [Bacteroidota bacterium]|nr:DUF4173 domain-containing protein [Bacteroidota bacterium]